MLTRFEAFLCLSHDLVFLPPQSHLLAALEVQEARQVVISSLSWTLYGINRIALQLVLFCRLVELCHDVDDQRCPSSERSTALT
jgi:hypothetical protein